MSGKIGASEDPTEEDQRQQHDPTESNTCASQSINEDDLLGSSIGVDFSLETTPPRFDNESNTYPFESINEDDFLESNTCPSQSINEDDLLESNTCPSQSINEDDLLESNTCPSQSINDDDLLNMIGDLMNDEESLRSFVDFSLETFPQQFDIDGLVEEMRSSSSIVENSSEISIHPDNSHCENDMVERILNVPVEDMETCEEPSESMSDSNIDLNQTYSLSILSPSMYLNREVNLESNSTQENVTATPVSPSIYLNRDEVNLESNSTQENVTATSVSPSIYLNQDEVNLESNSTQENVTATPVCPSIYLNREEVNLESNSTQENVAATPVGQFMVTPLEETDRCTELQISMRDHIDPFNTEMVILGTEMRASYSGSETLPTNCQIEEVGRNPTDENAAATPESLSIYLNRDEVNLESNSTQENVTATPVSPSIYLNREVNLESNSTQENVTATPVSPSIYLNREVNLESNSTQENVTATPVGQHTYSNLEEFYSGFIPSDETQTPTPPVMTAQGDEGNPQSVAETWKRRISVSFLEEPRTLLVKIKLPSSIDPKQTQTSSQKDDTASSPFINLQQEEVNLEGNPNEETQNATPPGDIFGGINDGLLSRAEALAAVDIGKHQSGPQGGPPLYHHGVAGPSHNARPHQMSHHSMEGLEMLDPLASTSMTTLAPMGESSSSHHQLHGYGAMNHVLNHHHHASALGHGPSAHLGHASAPLHPDADTDPSILESFAEKFKQRRIKLGVTQADVGKALANLKLPGVGALSQSTICRFESLTLSHNNMIALKPILHAWLEEAEAQAKNKRRDPDAPSVLPAGEKKRKRTSIASPEKRSLEAYFAVQPRPSGEKIAAIAEKLELKKNVVRVWFCNQRQKQKRMKFAAQH